DVGCGEGHAARYFADHGCDVVGIDGVWQLSQNWRFTMHDYTEGPLALRDPIDLIWSCEFVEHVEERYIHNFLTTFTAAGMVAMTPAEPGQPGYHHVNCRSADYWKGALAGIGFLCDDELTRQARNRAQMNGNPINHFSRSGLVFRAA